jgi:integral membrane protein
VSAFDAESGNLRYQAETAFYISGMVVPAHGDRLLVICSGNDKDNPDYKELLSVDVGTLGNKDALTAGGTALIVLAAVFLIVALFAALCAFRKNFIVKFRKTVLGMLRNWVTYLIILGSLALLILFCYYPGISSMVLSFFDYTRENPTMHFNNFENYIKIFTNEANLIAFRNMLVFLLADIVTALLPPIIFALCLAFMRSKRYSTFARVMLFLPTVLPGIANLLIWKDGIYGAEGVLNLLIRVLSGQSVEEYVPILFLQDHAMPSLIMMGFPFVGSYLVFYGALMNVPSSYYEAAELDGCPLFKRLGMIDLPMISSQIKYVFVLSFIQSVQNFGRVLMTTGGSITTGTQIPILLMYNNLMDGNYGLSSAYATLMFLILIVVTVLNMKIQTEDWEV